MLTKKIERTILSGLSALILGTGVAHAEERMYILDQTGHLQQCYENTFYLADNPCYSLIAKVIELKKKDGSQTSSTTQIPVPAKILPKQEDDKNPSQSYSTTTYQSEPAPYKSNSHLFDIDRDIRGYHEKSGGHKECYKKK